MIRARDLHVIGDDGNPTDSAGFPRGWKLMSQESRGNGHNNLAGLPRECLFILPYNVLLSSATSNLLKPLAFSPFMLISFMASEFMFDLLPAVSSGTGME